MTITGKRTRAERKAEHRKRWAELDRIEQLKRESAERYRREHPVLSGAVPVVDYVPPAGHYAWCD